MIAPVHDQFGRRIEYLRVSVTDKCNFRCLYCMPREGLQWLPKSEILSYEEIAAIVAQLSGEGISRIRITGGEPTIRPNLERLISMLKSIDGIDDIALSTNGLKLPELASLYRDAGLDRVNISADSLRPEKIAAIARRDLGFDPIAAALAADRLIRRAFPVVQKRSNRLSHKAFWAGRCYTVPDGAAAGIFHKRSGTYSRPVGRQRR